MTALNSGRKNAGLAGIIVKTGLLAGLLDIFLAFVYSYIKRGTSPVSVLQYIAKVAFGKTLITDPTWLAITGLLVHFAIAMCWTLLFFLIYRPLKLYLLNPFLTAFIYGSFVWAMMSVVILPVWNGKPYVFNAEGALINGLILIVAIGLPVSLMAKKKIKTETT